MTYIKTRLPDINTLKERYKENPNRFISIYRKYEILQGNEESIRYVEKKIK